jgi:uncharacterized low-complexity protein
MNKKTLALTLGGAMATVLTASPLVHAQENPFGMQKISGAQVLAEADAKMPEGGCSGSKMKEGKCGEGKCGANKMKMKEGGCSGAAMPEEKMKEGGCSGKMKEGGCSGKM